MRFDVLTLFPEIIESYCNVSIMKRAREGDVYSLNTINPRDFTRRRKDSNTNRKSDGQA